MSIYRVRKDTRYFVASNEPFNDERLSWEARGVMGYLLSKGDGWELQEQDLENKGPAGATTVKRIVRELRKAGYVRRYKERNPDGTFRWVTEVFESPSLNPATANDDQHASCQVTINSSPVDGPPYDGETPPIVNTESVITEPINNNSTSSYANDAGKQRGRSPATDERHDDGNEKMVLFPETTPLPRPLQQKADRETPRAPTPSPQVPRRPSPPGAVLAAVEQIEQEIVRQGGYALDSVAQTAARFARQGLDAGEVWALWRECERYGVNPAGCFIRCSRGAAPPAPPTRTTPVERERAMREATHRRKSGGSGDRVVNGQRLVYGLTPEQLLKAQRELQAEQEWARANGIGLIG